MNHQPEHDIKQYPDDRARILAAREKSRKTLEELRRAVAELIAIPSQPTLKT